MHITVELNKNLTLAYSLLNRFNLAEGKNKSSLQREVIDHFKEYTGTAPTKEEYGHEYKLVIWALSVSGPPTFQKRIELNEQYQWQFDKGSSIKPHLIKFYENSDFENFYNNDLLEKMSKLKTKTQYLIGKKGIIEILEKAWNFKINERMIVILNPFTSGSFGIQLEGINYQVIGNVDNKYLVSLILHEGSHPIAKEILIPFQKEIEKKQKYLKIAQKHPNFPKAYNSWNTCFEEHFIRALQILSMNPKVFNEYDMKNALEYEKNGNGMIFIDTFYKVLQSNNPNLAVPIILADLK